MHVRCGAQTGVWRTVCLTPLLQATMRIAGQVPPGLPKGLVAFASRLRSFHSAFMDRSHSFGSDKRKMKLAFRG
jgi:hypothetical protein